MSFSLKLNLHKSKIPLLHSGFFYILGPFIIPSFVHSFILYLVSTIFTLTWLNFFPSGICARTQFLSKSKNKEPIDTVQATKGQGKETYSRILETVPDELIESQDNNYPWLLLFFKISR